MKKYLIGIIIGLIISSTGIVVAYSLSSNDISFTPENSKWQVSNVEEAVNDLYDYSKKSIFDKLDFSTVTSEAYGDRLTYKSTSLTVDSGHYIVVANQAIGSLQANIHASSVDNGSPRFEYSGGQCSILKSKITNSSGTAKYSSSYVTTSLNEAIWKCSFDETTTMTFTTNYSVGFNDAGQSISAYAIKLD